MYHYNKNTKKLLLQLLLVMGDEMDINYELYKIFYVVATTGNVTAAAKELHISQPAVSKHIRNLECSLGGPLFIRSNQGMILTETGRAIYQSIKDGVNAFSNANLIFSDYASLLKGTIKIGISTSLTRFYLLPYLETFHKEYPNITILIYTDPSAMLKKKLQTGEIDFLIAKYNGPDSEFSFHPLGELHDIFIASSAYDSLRGKNLTLEELTKYPILLQREPSTSRRRFDAFCRKNNVSFDVSTYIASSTLLEDFVKIGFGIGVATKEYIQKELDQGNVFELSVTKSLPSISFGYYVLKDGITSFSVKKLIELLEKR